MGCDLALCYRELRKRFPDVDFTDCYMNPIMRKSGLTPDQLMRRQLYSLLKPRAQDDGVEYPRKLLFNRRNVRTRENHPSNRAAASRYHGLQDV